MQPTQPANYRKYQFRDRSGGIVDSRVTHVGQDLLGIGHTAFLSPWKDAVLHLHENSEEYYLLMHGEMDLVVAGSRLSLHPGELLMVRPGVPHAVTGGRGLIEHFGMRAPCLPDKRPLGLIPHTAHTAPDLRREVVAEWGCRIPLTTPENRNCWLIGMGAARIKSEHLILAHLDFQTLEAANAGIGTRLCLHLHTLSWEYYLVLRGELILQIENELVRVAEGEILEVPPNTRHNINRRSPPYQGFCLRVPLLEISDKVEG